jgi:hypothetical protein
LLRQQLLILNRHVKRPRLKTRDRLFLLLIASCLRTWGSALLIIKPETLLSWHRQGFKLFWKLKSTSRIGRPPLSQETILLIQQMARENCLWGAERIRGELLKLGIHVAKGTIQKYVRAARTREGRTQTWSTFMHNHAHETWACDFLPVIDLFFRQYSSSLSSSWVRGGSSILR